MKILPRILLVLPGLLLALALVVLLASSLIRHSEALSWVPAALRNINISVLHQFATDLIIAMTLFGAVMAARAPMPRALSALGLLFSLLMLMASVRHGYVSIMQDANIRTTFWLIPITSLMMALVLLHQLRAVVIAPNNYFPVSMGEGGIKTALLIGIAAFAWAIFKLGADGKILAQYFFDSLDQYTLMALPFLLLAGVFLNPQRRSGNLVPFALLALWLAAITGVKPAKVFFSIFIPGTLVILALWLSGIKNIFLAQDKPFARLMVYALVSALLIGSMFIIFVSFPEVPALVSLIVGLASIWILRNTKIQDLGQIFSYSAAQSAVWLYTGAVAVLWVHLLSDAPWLADLAQKIAQLKLHPGLFLLALSLLVSAACYLIGPVAAVLLSAVLLQPLATAIRIESLQLGAVLMMNVVVVKIFQISDAELLTRYPRFQRRRALMLTLIILALVALFPQITFRFSLYI
jgi:hypothetical protein